MTARDERDRMLVAQAHDRLHLCSRRWEHDDRRCLMQMRQAVGFVGEEIDGIGQDAVGAAGTTEFADEGGPNGVRLSYNGVHAAAPSADSKMSYT